MTSEHANDRLTLPLAAAPIVFLVALLACSVFLFGSDASYGPNQIALVLATCVAALVGYRTGLGWDAAQAGMVDGIGVGLG
ncbi:MAG TPA: Na+/H+ antiporter NhaC, partial [Pseudohaliea sp.]|nr:Na+/H+ antiporter NhaC [Pseudohaliea sp.]